MFTEVFLNYNCMSLPHFYTEMNFQLIRKRDTKLELYVSTIYIPSQKQHLFLFSTSFIHIIHYISSMKSKTATIFVSGNECLFLSTSFFLAILHDSSVPIIVGTMNNYVNFLFEIKTQPGVLLRPKR